MKTLELDSFNMVELSQKESEMIEGGWLKEIVMSLIDNWGDFREGMSDGYNNKSPRH
jgi:hypothetical protein